MTNVRFPFWIVSDGSPQTDDVRPSHDEIKVVYAFSSGDKVTGYLVGRLPGTWKISLVNDRNALVLAIADADRRGLVTACFDPNHDGSGGLPIDIMHLLDMCDAKALR